MSTTGPIAELATFISDNGRLPTIDDERKPWTYRGWLMPYVRQMHGTIFPDRYGAWDRMMSGGPLESIERVCYQENGIVVRGIEKILGALDRRDTWDAFGLFVEWLGFGLIVWPEASRLDQGEQEHLYRNVNLAPWLEKPGDHLGTCAANLAVGRSHGFFPTPHHVCEVMAMMTMDGADLESTVCDPCCGSGRTLLHAANWSYRLHGQEINGLLVLLTKINGALFVPWLAFPLPASAFSDRGGSQLRLFS